MRNVWKRQQNDPGYAFDTPVPEGNLNNGKKQEVIKLSYGEGDVIYLSIHLFHKISKFNSRDGSKPRIYKLE